VLRAQRKNANPCTHHTVALVSPHLLWPPCSRETAYCRWDRSRTAAILAFTSFMVWLEMATKAANSRMLIPPPSSTWTVTEVSGGEAHHLHFTREQGQVRLASASYTRQLTHLQYRGL
jgi:hypothetical protein